MDKIKAIMIDEKEYLIVDESTINGNDYLYMINSQDPEDFCIRKLATIDNQEMIVGLDSVEEFETVFKEIVSKINI